MRSLLALSFVCACLLLPSSLWAQGRVEEAPAYSPLREPRLRFGVAGTISGGGLTRTSDPELQGNVWAASLGFSMDLGVQVNDALAVYAHGIAATCFLLSTASLDGVVEYTPTPMVSVGTGVGWMGISNLPLPTDSGGSARSWQGLSIPMLVALNIGGRRPSGSVRAFRLGLEGALGFAPGTDDLAFRASLNIGYASM